MPFVAITYNAEGTGEAERAVVGRVHLGRRVLAIAGSDPITIVRDGGDILSVPAGSVVRVDPMLVPEPARAPSAHKRRAAPAPTPGAPIRSVTFRAGFGERAVSVGEELSGGRRVAAIVLGDEWTVVADDGSVPFRFAAGSVLAWT